MSDFFAGVVSLRQQFVDLRTEKVPCRFFERKIGGDQSALKVACSSAIAQLDGHLSGEASLSDVDLQGLRTHYDELVAV